MEGISKEQAEKILSHVPEDKKFYTHDGVYLSNLEELSNYLKKAKIESYNSHVNAEKNDFANWIYDVVGDVELAEGLRKAKNRKNVRETIRERLEYLKLRIKLN